MVRRFLMIGLGGLMLLAAAPAQAAWRKAESAHFVIYAEEGERDLRSYAADLEAFDAALRLLHGLNPGTTPPRKLPIYLLRGESDVRRVGPWIPTQVAGFYHAGRHDIFAVAEQRSGDSRVLFHEYTHHFMLQEFPASYPAWLVEGYAEYFMTADLERERVVIGEPDTERTAGMLEPARWIPLRELLAKRPTEFSERAVAQYYAEAWALTHYFVSDAHDVLPMRHRQLGAYLRALGAGKEAVAALEAVTGTPIERFEGRLQDYVRRDLSVSALPRATFSEALVRITPLPASADDLLLDHQAVISDYLPENASSILARVRSRAAKHPGDALAEDTLGIAELRLGDKAAGRAVLGRRLSVDPSDADALEFAADDLMDQGDAASDSVRTREFYRQAHNLLAKSFEAGLRYQTVAGLARARRVLDAAYPSENTLETLLLAQELAPQVDVLRLDAARALMLKARYPEATRLLTPLANSPHSSGRAETAKTLLKEIASSQGKPAV